MGRLIWGTKVQAPVSALNRPLRLVLAVPAVAVLQQSAMLIAGGTAKEGGIDSLVPLFPRIAKAFLIGRDAPILAKTLAEHGVAHEIVGTLDVATRAAADAAFAGAAPVVLLSPACASWDQFTGFDARGDRFRDLARAIAEEHA